MYKKISYKPTSIRSSHSIQFSSVHEKCIPPRYQKSAITPCHISSSTFSPPRYHISPSLNISKGLNISMSPPRLRAPMTAMTSTPSMSMSANMRLPHIRSIPPLIPTSTMHKRQQRRNSKENTVHNAKRETGLQHTTLFVRREMEPVNTR
jgi:hypothetical protein